MDTFLRSISYRSLLISLAANCVLISATYALPQNPTSESPHPPKKPTPTTQPNPNATQQTKPHPQSTAEPKPAVQPAAASSNKDQMNGSGTNPVQAGLPPSAYTANADMQAEQAKQEAQKAAFESGEQSGNHLNARSNINKRLKMVEESADRVRHPKLYTALPSKVVLLDPFAPPPLTSGLEDEVKGTCLQFDKSRGLAMVSSGCEAQGCLPKTLRAGDYPLLSDGNLVDTKERAHQFFAECKSSTSMQVVRGEGDVVTVE